METSQPKEGGNIFLGYPFFFLLSPSLSLHYYSFEIITQTCPVIQLWGIVKHLPRGMELLVLIIV